MSFRGSNWRNQFPWQGSKCGCHHSSLKQFANRLERVAQRAPLGLRSQQGRSACPRCPRKCRHLLVAACPRAFLLAVPRPLAALRSALRLRRLLNRLGCWQFLRRRAHPVVRVRTQRCAARRIMMRWRADLVSRESSDLPARIDLRELRTSRAGEVSHLAHIRSGWHACWLRSGRHRDGGHR